MPPSTSNRSLLPMLCGVLALLSLALMVFARYQPQTQHQPLGPSAAELVRDEAFAQAKQENKRVFLLFTQPGCEWCQRFDVYHADAAVKEIVKKHFVVCKVDIVDTPGGEVLYFEHGSLRNAPAFSILDSKGATLAHSGDSPEKNVGYPNHPEEIDRYLAALREACPDLTEDELETLRARLEALHSVE